MPQKRHKTRPGTAILLLLAVLGLPQSSHAQAPTPPVHSIRVGDVVAVGVGGAVGLLPRVLKLGRQTPDCSPCDPATVPGFDRWVIRDIRPGWSRASDVVLAAMAVLGAVDIGARSGGSPYLVAMVESATWTTAATEWLKAEVGRERPVLYTNAAPDYAGDVNSLRSFPSGHTSLAFAIATSYWFARRDLSGHPGWQGWLAVGAATGVGALRVASSKHFPSDVVAGAVLGVAGAAVVHVIKF